MDSAGSRYRLCIWRKDGGAPGQRRAAIDSALGHVRSIQLASAAVESCHCSKYKYRGQGQASVYLFLSGSPWSYHGSNTAWYHIGYGAMPHSCFEWIFHGPSSRPRRIFCAICRTWRNHFELTSARFLEYSEYAGRPARRCLALATPPQRSIAQLQCKTTEIIILGSALHFGRSPGSRCTRWILRRGRPAALSEHCFVQFPTCQLEYFLSNMSFVRQITRSPGTGFLMLLAVQIYV
ncbi:hypothetical protein DENSPDRAFT_602035 [Dentipellis sp. KUC8613]|nr:hypothetical protein DENSPDRAFT_602035 [Dentipellis sp. KUC8613]